MKKFNDRMLLESLVRKYGKNNLLNEMANSRGMRISEIINKLKELQDYCGDVNVRVVSDDYYLSIHNIIDIRESDDYNNNVEIVIG